jgi:serine/threonine-protein kinase
MRFIQGESLREAILRFHDADKRGRDAGERSLALRQLLTRFVTVCNTVAYAHSRGILHRDLKPSNIMLGKYGETLVVDWGLAKPFARDAQAKVSGEDTLAPTLDNRPDETQLGQVIGTPAYMSPEQAAGRWDLVGPSSDIYSLGATLYTILTGQMPFVGAKAEVLSQVQRGELRRLGPGRKDIPRALEAICLKAMAPQPHERYANALAIAADLEHWLADEPAQAYRESLLARLARWTRRHRSLVASAAALLITAVAALTIGLVVVQEAQRQTESQRQAAVSARIQADVSFGRAEQSYRLAREALEELKSTRQSFAIKPIWPIPTRTLAHSFMRSVDLTRLSKHARMRSQLGDPRPISLPWSPNTKTFQPRATIRWPGRTRNYSGPRRPSRLCRAV